MPDMGGGDARRIIGAYDTQAEGLVARYASLDPQRVNAAFVDLVPRGSDCLSLDVGAGSGRDAAWLASLGHEVVAVEPSAGMRAEGQRLHPEPAIRWVDDRLPGLETVMRLGLAFDVIVVNAVWMHVPPPQRPRAFRKLVTLLKPGGQLFMSLRHGPAPSERTMWDVPLADVEGLARDHGLTVQRVAASKDVAGRTDVAWTTICLRLPDDGSGGLPLIRGIILNDAKTATYKLALLRAVARIADTTPGLATPHPGGNDMVDVPLGAIAMNWLRMYLPLISAGLPQAPGNAGPDGLGFAKEGFRALLGHGVSGQDLRIGMRFTGERAAALARALGEARTSIARMPAHYTTFPNSDTQVFEAVPGRGVRAPAAIELDQETLAAFGTLRVPGHLWRTLQRLGAWVEPVLLAEWGRLIRSFAAPMGRTVSMAELEMALAWLDPLRDTATARAAVDRLRESGREVRCVWTGRRLDASRTDIDHCLPWTAWPCGDLWNLLPAHRHVNQRQKRHKLPSAAALRSARGAIINWWADAWLENAAFEERFYREAQAALPTGGAAAPEDIFTGLEWRRLRLRQDQQVEEWNG